MKEKFTPAEWQELKMLPFIVYRDVAYADQKADENEMRELDRSLRTATLPMLKELVTDILRRPGYDPLIESTDPVLAAARAEPEELERIKLRIKGFLLKELTAFEYQAFLAAIFEEAVAVARASGGFLGRGRISVAETQALESFASTFEIDPEVVKRHISG